MHGFTSDTSSRIGVLPKDSITTSQQEALAYKKLWDEFLSQANQLATEYGSQQVWHTSRLSVRAEVEEAIVGSVAVTLVIAVGCAFTVTLIFSHMDLRLALMHSCAAKGCSYVAP